MAVAGDRGRHDARGGGMGHGLRRGVGDVVGGAVYGDHNMSQAEWEWVLGMLAGAGWILLSLVHLGMAING